MLGEKLLILQLKSLAYVVRGRVGQESDEEREKERTIKKNYVSK